jgi:hypothetical protein
MARCPEADVSAAWIGGIPAVEEASSRKRVAPDPGNGADRNWTFGKRLLASDLDPERLSSDAVVHCPLWQL